MTCSRIVLSASIVALSFTAVLQAQNDFKPRPFDWPQWQGPDRNAISKEKSLLKTWPAGGPKLVWRINNLGESFSTPSIASGRIFTMGNADEKEYVYCLREKDGSELWKTSLGPQRNVRHSGTRCTPTVDGNRVYALGAYGDLACLNVSDGKIAWQINLTKKYGGRPGGWKYAESPLIDGEKIVVTPGGGKATLVALNKMDGKLIWKSAIKEGYSAGYSSIISAEVDGLRQYIQFLGRGGRNSKDASKGAVVGVRSMDGKFLWSYSDPGNRTANITTPVFYDNHVFAASAYSTGGALAQLSRNGDSVDAKVVYFTSQMQNHHGGMILLDGYLYGNNRGELVCMEFKTGKVAWRSRQPGKGSIVFADGRLYYRNERNGQVYLVEATPKEYKQHGTMQQPDRSSRRAWAHPVVANGRLYIADQNVLFCYDVKEE